MAIGPNSASIRIFLGDEHLELRGKFKQLVAVAHTSMSKRMALFIEKDVAYWEATGEILDIEAFDIERSEKSDRLGELIDKLDCLINTLQPDAKEQTNGHNSQQVKITKPRKHHKAYKGQTGELLAELAGNQIKVGFDNGEEKAFYEDEIEIVG